jgi:hypothetical protein
MRALSGFFGRFGRRAAAAWVLVGAGLAVAAPASADSCREWRVEHHHWKSETVRRYLDGSPTRELDTSVFELLQREAYLTSCNLPVGSARESFVGWRLVGLAPDEYGRAVVESLLAEAGLALDVRAWFGPMLSQAPAATIEYLTEEQAAAPIPSGRVR